MLILLEGPTPPRPISSIRSLTRNGIDTNTGYMPYRENTTVFISLEDLPTTNDNIENCPIHKSSKSMLDDNGHQHIISKTLRTLYSTKYTTIYSTYNTKNNLAFSESDQGLVKSSFHGKLGFYEIIKYRRYSLLGIYSYLQGQFSKKVCVATARNKLIIFNIVAQILRGWGNISLSIGRS